MIYLIVTKYDEERYQKRHRCECNRKHHRICRWHRDEANRVKYL